MVVGVDDLLVKQRHLLIDAVFLGDHVLHLGKILLHLNVQCRHLGIDGGALLLEFFDLILNFVGAGGTDW